MIIIGEKLNGAIPSVAEFIVSKDEVAIRNLARIQTESGADYLDVCAGISPELELTTLEWMLDIVQDEVNTPICIDSPDPKIIESVLPRIKNIGIINSVSGEGDKCDVIFPLIAKTNWKLIALTCDNKGIPADAKRKIEIGSLLIERAEKEGIEQDRIFVDPLVLSLSAVNDALISFIDAIKALHKSYPNVHFTSGLSNISFGMPRRKLINQNFLAFALEGGMDSAIMDPTSKDMYSTILAAEVLLGRDKFCRKYNGAYRKGRI